MKNEDHAVKETVEMMGSKLYFHGHPINRKEAKEDVGLKIAQDVSTDLEGLMWDLYIDFEKEFENREPFFPAGTLSSMPIPTGNQSPPRKMEVSLLHGIIRRTSGCYQQSGGS